ncbi:MAG TPA: protease pro-enzyme activation domain-containing protein, partial [Ktedonobacterales bacterium]
MRFWRNLPLFARRRPYGPLGVAAAILIVLALVAIFLSGTAGIFASPNSPSTHAIDTHHSHQVRLHGVKPRALNDLKATGKEDGARLLQLSIALRLAQPIALNGLIAQQQAHSSAQYHQYLTPQSFTDHYAPSADNVAAVRNFLQQSGMKVTGISSNRLLVNAEGTVA